MQAYHSFQKEETLKILESSENGLSSAQAAERLAKNGKNELEQAKKKTLLQKFFAQFKDVMIIVLIAAAIISAAIAIFQKEYSELFEGGIILIIVIINAVIGLVQENKAEAALEALKNMNKPFSKVIRDGELMQIRSEDIVTGDIVQLDAGDVVPADIRLLTSASLKIEEAALTGESVPSEKSSDDIVKEDAALGDRDNMAYCSGKITYGRGKGVVIATGMDTEVGKIARMLENAESDATPLQKQLAKTAKILSVIVLVIAVIIFAASLIRKNPLIEAFMTSVAIAVAAIPEGLPAVVTIVLAVGVQRMSKRNAVIRNLPAVETLGCCEIICSDKTGTLTLNQMTVQQIFTLNNGLTVSDAVKLEGEIELLIRAGALCNDTEESAEGILIGDPTETALVAFAKKCGIDYRELKKHWPRIDERPFDSVRKLMATINGSVDKTVAYIKGAPDLLIDKCANVLIDGKIEPLTEETLNTIRSANKDMAKRALRVLGVAVKFQDFEGDSTEQNMIFVGLVGMIDPPRPEVKKAVEVCIGAGMRPLMITGDHADTAAAIAKEIGILKDGDKVITGAEIDKISDEDFAKIITEYSVFARVSPENKVRIVKAYRSMGKVVAMTGDGVNDAPSIKEADIGIGMGITGTDVSKGAADMVLTDDNFATIISAVEEGRKIFSNIKKAIQFLLSANIAEVLCLFIATVILNVKFLTPVMILWVNLVTDSLPALALGMEEAEKNVMKAPPRKANSSLFAGKTGFDIMIQGVMQTILVMLSFAIGNYVLPDGIDNHAVAMTMAFVSLCMIQLFHSYNLRSQNYSLFGIKPFSNKKLNLSFLIGFALLLAVILIPPVRTVFDTAPLTIGEWAISIGVALMIIPFVELQKLIERAVIKRKNFVPD